MSYVDSKESVLRLPTRSISFNVFSQTTFNSQFLQKPQIDLGSSAMTNYPLKEKHVFYAEVRFKSFGFLECSISKKAKNVKSWLFPIESNRLLMSWKWWA